MWTDAVVFVGPCRSPVFRQRSLPSPCFAGRGGSFRTRGNCGSSGSSSGGGGPLWLGAVLVAPPNRGSDLARELLLAPSTPSVVRRLFRFLFGPAVLDLASSSEVIAREWPDAPRPCGVIAGTAPRSLNPASLLLAARVFGGRAGGSGGRGGSGEGRRPARAHDGTVAVDETALQIPADDFAAVHAGHTLMADSREVAGLVTAFLLSGKFS